MSPFAAIVTAFLAALAASVESSTPNLNPSRIDFNLSSTTSFLQYRYFASVHDGTYLTENAYWTYHNVNHPIPSHILFAFDNENQAPFGATLKENNPNGLSYSGVFTVTPYSPKNVSELRPQPVVKLGAEPHVFNDPRQGVAVYFVAQSGNQNFIYFDHLNVTDSNGTRHHQCDLLGGNPQGQFVNIQCYSLEKK